MAERQESALDAALRRMSSQDPSRPRSLSIVQSIELARDHGATRREVEVAALRAGLPPQRYRRNYGTVGIQGQIRLLESTVGVVGAGGLGGWVIEALARMGIGHLIIIDGDVFEENNLNRQACCTEATLGQPKAAAAAERASQVNGAVVTTVHHEWLTEANAVPLLHGARILVDALDSLPARIMLQAAARELRVPLVHGAIAGYTGQVMTIYPEDAGLASIYGPGPYPEHGVEAQLGNPTATPMMVAAWQVQQVVQYLTGHERGLLRNRLLLLDAQAGDALTLNLGE